MLVVHYHQDTGEISAWGNNFESNESFIPDHKVAVIQNTDHASIHAATHKIDIEYLTIVEKPQDERKVITLFDVQQAIRQSLSASDEFVVPDRPMTVDVRRAWMEYRQALRDLSKLETPMQMFNAWPMCPNGNDAVAMLRFKLMP